MANPQALFDKVIAQRNDLLNQLTTCQVELEEALAKIKELESKNG